MITDGTNYNYYEEDNCDGTPTYTSNDISACFQANYDYYYKSYASNLDYPIIGPSNQTRAAFYDEDCSYDQMRDLMDFSTFYDDDDNDDGEEEEEDDDGTNTDYEDYDPILFRNPSAYNKCAAIPNGTILLSYKTWVHSSAWDIISEYLGIESFTGKKALIKATMTYQIDI